MRKKCIFIPILITLLLTGCVSQKDYDRLEEENRNLTLRIDTLEVEKYELQTELDRINSQQVSENVVSEDEAGSGNTRTELEITKQKLEETQTKLDDTQEELEQTTSELEKIKKEYGIEDVLPSASDADENSQIKDGEKGIPAERFSEEEQIDKPF